MCECSLYILLTTCHIILRAGRQAVGWVGGWVGGREVRGQVAWMCGAKKASTSILLKKKKKYKENQYINSVNIQNTNYDIQKHEHNTM